MKKMLIKALQIMYELIICFLINGLFMINSYSLYS